MYLLGERSDDEAAPFVQEIQGQEALLSPVANTYMNFLLDTDMRACELEALGRLAARVPLRRVVAPNDPGQAYRLCETIIRDLRGSPAETERDIPCTL